MVWESARFLRESRCAIVALFKQSGIWSLVKSRPCKHESLDEPLTQPPSRRLGARRFRPLRRGSLTLKRTLQHGFARLVTSEAVVDVGLLARVAAQSWVAYDLTSSSLWVGAVAAFRAVPSFVSPAFAAHIVNRFNHRLLISAMRAFIGILAIIQAVLIGTGRMQPWHQAVLTLFTGLAIAIAAPAFVVFLRDELQPRLVSRASSVLGFAHNSGEFTGPLLVGVIIAYSGAEWSFVFIALLYFAGAFFILVVPLPPRDTDIDSAHVPYLTLLRIGARHTRRNQPLPWLLAILGVSNLFSVTVFPLIPEYAIDVHDSGGLGFGLMAGSVGAGFAVGSATIGIFGLPRRKSIALITCSTIWAVGSAAFAFSPNLPTTLGILFTMGVAAIVWSTVIYELFRSHAPSAHRARVMSLHTVAMGLIPIGWAIGGAIAAFTDRETALIAAAISSIAITITAYIASPELRRA